MPVFFGRDISQFSDFISVWYGSSPMLRQPSKVDPRPLSLRLASHTHSALSLVEPESSTRRIIFQL